MTLGVRGRKLLLAVHIAVSVGWIGAVTAYLVLDLTVALGANEQTLRAAYIGMELIAMQAIVPLAVATLISGVLLSLLTPWGLFRHYWVVISLILTIFALGILLLETQTIRYYGRVAADPGTPMERLASLGNTLPHSVGGLFVLLIVMVLNILKPRGLTRYGWSRLQALQRDTRDAS